MKPMIYHKPYWDKTGDPTIDPTLLDPGTGMPIPPHTIQSLTKKHLFTAEEWQAVLVQVGLITLAPITEVPAKKASLTEEEKEAKKAARREAFLKRMAEAREAKKKAAK